jgi:hypothetical protein
MTVSDRTEQPTVLTKEEARSGETSGHVRRILSISMTLTIIGLAAVFGWFALFR